MEKSSGFLACLGILPGLILPISMSYAATELSPGVLVDAAAGTVYAMHPNGGVDAISVTAGKLLWHSDDADKPLATNAGRLLAHVDAADAGVVELVILDAEAGSVVNAKTLELPGAVRAKLDDGVGTKFILEARTACDPIILTWEYSKRLVRGTKSKNDNKTERASGGIHVDVRSNSFVEVLPSLIPEKPVRTNIEGEYLPDVDGRQFLSTDGQHVLVSVRDKDSKTRSYAWSVYDLGGQLVGQTTSTVSFSPYIVVEGILMFVTKPQTSVNASGDVCAVAKLLRGVSLETGKQQWSHEIRDTDYRGSVPR